MIYVAEPEMAIIKDILQKHVPDRAVWVFGSRYRGNHRKFSDLDLIITGPEKIGISLWGDIKFDFEDSDLPYRVDILDWCELTPEFRAVVLRQGYAVLQENGNRNAV
jgi:predicted nucleotidyltransferase